MSSVSETTMVTRIFSENDFFIPLDSLLPPASDGVNIIINLSLIKIKGIVSCNVAVQLRKQLW